MNISKNQELLCMLDLQAAPIILNRSPNHVFLIMGAIFFIIILCYYFFIKTKYKNIIKILKLVEKKPNYQNLILGQRKFKDWLCYFNIGFSYMTEMEIAKFLRSNGLPSLADFIESSNNIKYQCRVLETNFSNILVTNAITEIKNIKNAKSIFKIKL